MSAPLVVARQARVLQILRHLQAGSGLNVDQLAGRLDVCRRTVFRDLSLLRQAGIAFTFDAAGRCYRLKPRNEFLLAPELDADELATLVTAIHLSMLQVIPDCRDVLRHTTNKLLAQTSFHFRHGVTLLAGSCVIEPPPDSHSPQTARVLHQVLQALGQRRWLRMRLDRTHPDGPVETKFATYQVSVNLQAWHITGRSSFHRQVRTFDARDVAQADVVDEAYAIPRAYRLG